MSKNNPTPQRVTPPAPPETPPAPPPPAPPETKREKELREGFAEMIAPEGTTGCSFQGESYDVADGVVCVPVEAVAVLFSHGFTTSKESA